MSNATANRRDFLKATTGIVAGVAAPYIWTGSQARAEESKNDRPSVGFIGVGGRGTYVGNIACKFGPKVACADVNLRHAGRFAGGSKCEAYQDYRKLLDRKDIDVVTIGTPDHWHTKIVIDAVKAGKDVYCEKPLTLTIDEGKKLCEAVKQTGRVVQVGTQQRSIGQFLAAVTLAQSGRLGKVLKATCFIPVSPTGGPFPTADPPAHLDWDMWLGQCPMVPYTPERCGRYFRYWLEYSGGRLTDWGAHHLDIAQWALGYENSGPVEIEGRGLFPIIPENFDPVGFFAGKVKLPNGYNVSTEIDVTLTFANKSRMVVVAGSRNGILIEGEKGRIFVNRARITGKPIEELTKADRDWLVEDAVRLNKGRFAVIQNELIGLANSDNSISAPDRMRAVEDLYFMGSLGHMRDFFACVRDRSQPASDVFTHHRAVSSCHLCNIAMLLKRKLRWDPAKEQFIGDAEANALVSRPQRAPYKIET